MPQKTTSTGPSSSVNPAIMGSEDSSTQAYGRSRSGSTEQRGDTSTTSDVVKHAKETISTVASQAGDKVTAHLHTKRDRAASSLGSVAQALLQSDDALVDMQQYVSSAAHQIERVRRYFRFTNVKQMV